MYKIVIFYDTIATNNLMLFNPESGKFRVRKLDERSHRKIVHKIAKIVIRKLKSDKPTFIKRIGKH